MRSRKTALEIRLLHASDPPESVAVIRGAKSLNSPVNDACDQAIAPVPSFTASVLPADLLRDERNRTVKNITILRGNNSQKTTVNCTKALSGLTCEPDQVQEPGCGRPKKIRAAAVEFVAETSAVSPRSRATSSQMCARYIGSLRRWLGWGRTVRGNK